MQLRSPGETYAEKNLAGQNQKVEEPGKLLTEYLAHYCFWVFFLSFIIQIYSLFFFFCNLYIVN